ncbi:S41 family peptidase [Flavihumibacter rivuli]|uniref:S41 family peptidase n=1 Tax=Flavihumibacter rivuli TaxID=2838156 RepID=UPI001BDE9A23|nr:S41 family peptidase [Flavihumibacter rivuli]ULQ57658.1 S41 family peptidase [Flavihumibacter rivuli]
MRSSLILFIMVLFSVATKAQECDCLVEFRFVKSHMEKNHPGFNSDIKSPEDKTYRKFVRSLEKSINKDKQSKYCRAYILKYINYLKDHHSNYYASSRNVVENNPDSLKAFLASPVFTGTEKAEVDSAAVMKYLKSLKQPGIEGIYTSSDGTYTVALLKNKKSHRDYYGLILASKTPLWVKGQVKLELKENGGNSLDAYIFMRNHSLNFEPWKLRNGQLLNSGWKKVYPAAAELAIDQSINNDGIISFKVLDDSTSMISIRSFGGQFSAQLDSAYKKIIPEISKYPNLIIDVRNNGGGSDANYRSLMPLLYTDTIFYDFVEMFVTAENKKAYEDIRDVAKKDTVNWGRDGWRNWQYRITQMDGKPFGSYVAISNPGAYRTFQPIKGNPVKVAILYNNKTASSAEQLIIDAGYSKKTILVGENSGGYIAYGNVMDIQTPCGNLLNWTTTRKNKDRKYEFVGITPHYKVPDNETNWVEYTRKLLQSK